MPDLRYNISIDFKENKNMKEYILKSYFQSWIDNNISILSQIFSENVIYSECYGPEYHGISQIHDWFEDWHKQGKILQWDIKRSIESNNTLIVEWYFKCNYNGEISEFNGVTVADFDSDNRIHRLSEYQSKCEHYYPYDSK